MQLGTFISQEDSTGTFFFFPRATKFRRKRSWEVSIRQRVPKEYHASRPPSLSCYVWEDSRVGSGAPLRAISACCINTLLLYIQDRLSSNLLDHGVDGLVRCFQKKDRGMQFHQYHTGLLGLNQQLAQNTRYIDIPSSDQEGGGVAQFTPYPSHYHPPQWLTEFPAWDISTFQIGRRGPGGRSRSRDLMFMLLPPLWTGNRPSLNWSFASQFGHSVPIVAPLSLRIVRPK